MGMTDVVIIGGGIAGLALAHALVPGKAVVVLEAESHCGFHATGRSAALYSETYGNSTIRALTRATGPFLRHPPEGFADQPLLRARGALHLARPDQMDRYAPLLMTLQAEVPTINPLTGPECRTLAPLLREGYAAAGILEPGACDIDVDQLLSGFMRGARAQGAEIATDATVTGISHDSMGWRVESTAGVWRAPVLVNAAGAWADQVALLAGVRPIGLTPLRRTAVLVDAPPGIETAHLPFLIDIDEQFYVKPEAGKLLLSPADETPSPPCDAQPEEVDIATAIDRVQRACDVTVQRKGHSWAGLRSFVGDRSPVVGFDADHPGFFWVAALGGYGIQMSSAIAALAAGLIRGEGIPDRLIALGFDAAMIDPGRCRA